jgi:hypothetical protein
MIWIWQPRAWLEPLNALQSIALGLQVVIAVLAIVFIIAVIVEVRRPDDRI